MKDDKFIFYSWQSDLEKETNEKAIRIELKKIIPEIEEKFDSLNLNIDEATRNESGSPEIPHSILKKITNCDVFVCDITTINYTEKVGRKTPNPNVIFELGFAVSQIGWERIILLFNENYGDFKTELPFDLEKRRVTKFRINDKNDKNGKGDLKSKLLIGITNIIESNPNKPKEKETKNLEQIKREKDINNLKKILFSVHIPTFDTFLFRLPNRIIDRIFYFWYTMQGIYESNSFYIYNQELKEKITEFYHCWDNTLKYGHLFTANNSGDYNLSLPFDVFANQKDEEDFKKLTNETIKLREIFPKFIEYIRNFYIEIDLDEISSESYLKYIEYNKD
ncbi:TIR domain-containing protein [Cloacibacterium sp.]|uniref:TIR domain-containing protein n=1 Tax=Cloacibacterium sp. TaxID=1913682 RepID=UPI0039E3700B